MLSYTAVAASFPRSCDRPRKPAVQQQPGAHQGGPAVVLNRLGTNTKWRRQNLRSESVASRRVNQDLPVIARFEVRYRNSMISSPPLDADRAPRWAYRQCPEAAKRHTRNLAHLARGPSPVEFLEFRTR